jgi:hypothetical protein
MPIAAQLHRNNALRLLHKHIQIHPIPNPDLGGCKTSGLLGLAEATDSEKLFSLLRSQHFRYNASNVIGQTAFQTCHFGGFTVLSQPPFTPELSSQSAIPRLGTPSTLLREKPPKSCTSRCILNDFNRINSVRACSAVQWEVLSVWPVVPQIQEARYKSPVVLQVL